MKRFFILFLVAILADTTVIAYDGYASIHTRDNRHYSGRTIEMTDSVLTIRLDKSFALKKIQISTISYGIIGNSYLISKDGVLIEVARETYNNAIQAIASGKEPIIQKKPEKVAIDWEKYAKDPNYTIGKAIQTSGAVGLSIGVPSLAVGAFLRGLSERETKDNDIHKMEVNGRLKEAGNYLMGVGASLTIISIPLYVGGKHVINMSITTTGTDVGARVEF